MLSDPPNPAPSPPEAAAPRPRILVVEDDFLIRMMLTEMLGDAGYDIVEAESGDQALPLLDASIALLLTDIQLPGSLNGPALAARARQLRPDLPVIYTSGRTETSSSPNRREMSIAKPYQNTEICAAVRRMLAG